MEPDEVAFGCGVTMRQRFLAGKRVPVVGLGCMGMSEFYGGRDDERSLTALRGAYEVGYRHYDTADMYGMGHNEELLGRFLVELGPRRHDVVVATKVGLVRDPSVKYKLGHNGRPEYIRRACEASLRRLGVDRIDLYYLHRQDPEIPIAESVGALGELIREGKAGAIGLSEVTGAALEAAHREHPISAVQSEYSLWSRDVERDVAPLCRNLGISFVAFCPLGRGILTGALSKQVIRGLDPAQDLRALLPRFQEEHLDKNLALVERLCHVAAKLGLEPAHVALAWLFSKGEDVHVIPGSTSRAHLTGNFEAGGMVLPEAALAELEAVFALSAVSGGRYPARPPPPAAGRAQDGQPS